MMKNIKSTLLLLVLLFQANVTQSQSIAGGNGDYSAGMTNWTNCLADSSALLMQSLPVQPPILNYSAVDSNYVLAQIGSLSPNGGGAMHLYNFSSSTAASARKVHMVCAPITGLTVGTNYNIVFDAAFSNCRSVGYQHLGMFLDSCQQMFDVTPADSAHQNWMRDTISFTAVSSSETFWIYTCATAPADSNMATVFVDGINVIASTALPIKLLTFQAEKEESYVDLAWTTASELNNDYFEIQRKNQDETDFETIGKMSGAGNSQTRRNYRYTDLAYAKTADFVDYRLQQVDYDGTSSYSKVVRVYNDKQLQVQVYPNPVAEDLFVKVETEHLVHLKLIASNGVVMLENEAYATKNTIHIKPGTLASGSYMLIVSYDGKQLSKKIQVY